MDASVHCVHSKYVCGRTVSSHVTHLCYIIHIMQ